MAATASDGAEGSVQKLAEAIKRFARSIELCDDYLRGYYGLKLVRRSNRAEWMGPVIINRNQVTSRLLKEPTKPAKQTDPDGFAMPDTATVERLNELATEKLSEIVRRSGARERGWCGYDEAEVAAARELLSKDSSETAK